jgi:6-phosphogluconolactonase
LRPELVVVADIGRAAAERFLLLRPRTVALAGGSTPRPLYERLATRSFAWQETDVFFTDERCVPPEHDASNYRMAQDALLSKVPARVHRMRGETCDASAYEEELSAAFGPGLPWFDLVLLGLGEDGHTASLFPNDPALEIKDRRVARVERPDHARLTLTLPVLSAAKNAIFLVAGARKRAMLCRLLEGEDIPATRVRAASVVVFADEAAVR